MVDEFGGREPGKLVERLQKLLLQKAGSLIPVLVRTTFGFGDDAIDEAQVERDLSRKIVDETRRMTLETLRASRSAIESSRS